MHVAVSQRWFRGFLRHAPRTHSVPGVRHGEPSMQVSAKSQGVAPDLGTGMHSARPLLPEKRKFSQHTAPLWQSALSSQRARRSKRRPAAACSFAHSSHCVCRYPMAPTLPSSTLATHVPASPAAQHVSTPPRQLVGPHANVDGSDLGGTGGGSDGDEAGGVEAGGAGASTAGSPEATAGGRIEATTGSATTTGAAPWGIGAGSSVELHAATTSAESAAANVARRKLRAMGESRTFRGLQRGNAVDAHGVLALLRVEHREVHAAAIERAVEPREIGAAPRGAQIARPEVDRVVVARGVEQLGVDHDEPASSLTGNRPPTEVGSLARPR